MRQNKRKHFHSERLVAMFRLKTTDPSEQNFDISFHNVEEKRCTFVFFPWTWKKTTKRFEIWNGEGLFRKQHCLSPFVFWSTLLKSGWTWKIPIRRIDGSVLKVFQTPIDFEKLFFLWATFLKPIGYFSTPVEEFFLWWTQPPFFLCVQMQNSQVSFQNALLCFFSDQNFAVTSLQHSTFWILNSKLLPGLCCFSIIGAHHKTGWLSP